MVLGAIQISPLYNAPYGWQDKTCFHILNIAYWKIKIIES